MLLPSRSSIQSSLEFSLGFVGLLCHGAGAQPKLLMVILFSPRMEYLVLNTLRTEEKSNEHIQQTHNRTGSRTENIGRKE